MVPINNLGAKAQIKWKFKLLLSEHERASEMTSRILPRPSRAACSKVGHADLTQSCIHFSAPLTPHPLCCLSLMLTSTCFHGACPQPRPQTAPAHTHTPQNCPSASKWALRHTCSENTLSICGYMSMLTHMHTRMPPVRT